MNILAKVVSGGQDGVDVAALRAAKALGVPTGGAMPLGWWTHSGSHPEYAELYGMIEWNEPGYAARTLENVRYADFTLRIARWFNSPGEVCTMKSIKRVHRAAYKDRYEDVTVMVPDLTDRAIEMTCACFVTRLSNLRDVLGHSVVLNVAGNSEKRAPGIGALAERFVRELLEECARRDGRRG